ncbi:MAG: hypothetical protein K6F98_01200 [Bacteroidales bacterium]|nr:hypothetical protein [Bacteroidales bacterium]
MNILVSSHRNGEDIVSETLLSDIRDTFSKVEKRVERYEISDIRQGVIDDLQMKGWSDKIFLALGSNISITAKKDDVGLCMQTGNVSRVYADLMKLQTLFMNGNIKAGIIIVATTDCARQYTCNAATYERLVRELDLFSQVITMPLVIVGFYN